MTMKRLCSMLALAISLVLAGPLLAGDIAIRVNYVVMYPEEGTVGSLTEHSGNDALEAVARLHEKVGLHDATVEDDVDTVRCAIAERDVIIAILLEKLLTTVHPDLRPTVREELAKRVDLAERVHYVLSLPIR